MWQIDSDTNLCSVSHRIPLSTELYAQCFPSITVVYLSTGAWGHDDIPHRPLQSSFMQTLSFKTAFLLALTSVKRGWAYCPVGEPLLVATSGWSQWGYFQNEPLLYFWELRTWVKSSRVGCALSFFEKQGGKTVPALPSSLILDGVGVLWWPVL